MFRGPLVVSVQRSAGASAAFRTQYNMSNRTSNPNHPSGGEGGMERYKPGRSLRDQIFFFVKDRP